MLALRLVVLARGGPAVPPLRRLPLAAATACVCFLLLTALGHALTHPQRTDDSVARLLWCLAPLAATAHLAGALARTERSVRPGSALAAAGLGSGRTALLAASSTALSCLLGSAPALAFYLLLRARVAGTALGDAEGATASAGQLLAAGRPLPTAGVLTLLCVPPAVAAGAAGLAARARTRAEESRGTGRRRRPVLRTPPLSCGLPLVALGLAVETSAGRHATAAPGTYGAHPAHLAQVTGHVTGHGPLVLCGWLAAAAGLLLCAPGFARLCGLLLTVQRPGPARLLAGRTLQRDAGRLGPALGLLCAAAVAAVAAVAVVRLHGAGAGPGVHIGLPRLATVSGLLVLLGAAVVAGCVLAVALLAVAESRAAHAATGLLLSRIGAPRSLIRAVGAWRAGVLALVLGPFTAGVGVCAALPLAGGG